MIEHLSQAADQLAVGCWFADCPLPTQWRVLPEKLDLLTVLGVLSSVVAVLFAAAAISQSAKARNLSTIIEITRQIYEERQKAQDLNLYGWDGSEFHAYQMIHLVEQASMIINHRMISGESRAFLRDWLKVELPAMAKQDAYKLSFAIASGTELGEMRKLYREICAEIKQEEHFERIYRKRKK